MSRLRSHLEETFQALKAKLRSIHHLRDTAALLSWDQETYMPPGGGEARAEQLATLHTLAHEAFISPEVESLLAAFMDPATGTLHEPIASSWEEAPKALLRETWRDFHRAKKLPPAFVAELERTCALAQQAWIQAKQHNAFTEFLPHLRTIVRLKREEADYLGYTETRYDALLDTYEPHMTTSRLLPLFSTLREQLTALLARIQDSSHRPDTSFFCQAFPPTQQLEVSRHILTAMGYDFAKGRLDISAHPFTTSFHPTDVRITTRLDERNPTVCLFSVLHEGGHALYEQGLPSEEYGTPLAEPVSLGIHESQSRLWENCVGRSQDFWQAYFPVLQQAFPTQLRNCSPEAWFRAVNFVQPSLIRVDADEVTYNLHIILRFELERALIEEDLPVEELPVQWQAKMQEYLGVRPAGDADGVLQDIHWAHGAFGYFPTYTIGNLCAAMLYRQACCDLPTLTRDIAQGQLLPLTHWLNTRVHRWGRQLSADELMTRITGHPISPEPFIRYLQEKYQYVYTL
ncbi:MAG: carboxypeptidase M32 [Nitrospirae bacterium]|nr:MAG: carboxypeptidase M32 [Nitrospirota bacterium]